MSEASIKSCVEPLEGRLFLSAALKGSALVVNGTPSADSITISANATDPSKIDVSDNGVVSSFNAAAVRRIKANGKAGNDVISVNGVNIPAVLKGAAGDDRLTGGAGDDRLTGGKGDDELDGGDGTDRVVGGPGSDLYDSSDSDAERSGFNEADDGVRIALADAPAAVQASVNSVLAGSTLTTLSRSNDDNGALIYEAQWSVGGVDHEAEIAPDGTINKRTEAVDVSALPAPAAAAVSAKYPNAPINAVERETLADGSVQYDVEVIKGRSVRALVVSPTGQILADEFDGRVGG
jgi:hypothetical protein